MSVIKEMRDVCQPRRLNRKGKSVWASHWHNALFTRHISIYFTYVFVKLGVSANTVTLLMTICGIVGALLCMPHNIWLTVAGAVALIMFEVLDCVDGEVARWTKKSSVRGWYLDLVSHVFCNNLVKVMCAVHLYLLTQKPVYLILIFVTYFASASEQNIQRCYYYACHFIPKDKENAKEANRNELTLKAFLLRRFWNLVKMPVEIIIVKLSSVIAIIFWISKLLT